MTLKHQTDMPIPKGTLDFPIWKIIVDSNRWRFLNIKQIIDEKKVIGDIIPIGWPEWGPDPFFTGLGQLPFALSSPHQFGASQFSDVDQKKLAIENINSSIQQLKTSITYLNAQIEALEKQRNEI